MSAVVLKSTAPLAEQIADLTRRLEIIELGLFGPKAEAEKPTDRRLIALAAKRGDQPRPVLLKSDGGRNLAFDFVSRTEACRFNGITSLLRSFTLIQNKGFEITWSELTDDECLVSHGIELERIRQAKAAQAEADKPRKWIILAGKDGEDLRPVHQKGSMMDFQWEFVERTRADVFPTSMQAVRSSEMLRVKGLKCSTEVLSDEDAANSRPIVEPPAKLPGRNVFEVKAPLRN